MKKVLALVLTLVLVLGLGVFSVSAAPAGDGITDGGGLTDTDKNGNSILNSSNVTTWSLLTATEDDLSAYEDFATLWLGDSTVQKQFGLIKSPNGGWWTPIRADYLDNAGNSLPDPADQQPGLAYGWRGDYKESTSISISYTTEVGGRASGSPKGVNGEELLHTRIAFNSDWRRVSDGASGWIQYGGKDYLYNMSNYIIYMTPVANPTVEVFRDVEVKVRLVRSDTTTNVDGSKAARYDAIVWSGFSLANKRYTDKHVYSDANGIYRIDASSNWPVLDISALQKSYGKKLIVDYPTYRVIFPTVKSQDTSLNLQAAVTKQATVTTEATDLPLMVATFHDIYVKDTVQIEFKTGFDVQNYKGTKLYAYALNADGTVNKSKELAVTVTEHKTVVIEVPASTKLSANGASNDKLGSIGLFERPQADGTQVSSVPSTSSSTGTTGGGSTSTENPKTGASDVVNVATAFAVVSLAAAAFVSVKKASK